MMNNRSRTTRGLALVVVAAAALATSACNKQGSNGGIGGIGGNGGTNGPVIGGGGGGGNNGGDLKVHTKDTIGPAMQASMKGDFTTQLGIKASIDTTKMSGGASQPAGMPSKMDITGDGQLAIEGTTPKMKMDLKMMGIDMQMVAIGNKQWMKAQQFTGDMWEEQTSGSSSVDPSKTFDSFSKDVENLTFVGTEDVSGEKMNHYKVTSKSAGSGMDSLLGSGSSGLGSSSSSSGKSQTFDLWLDSKDRMRKVAMNETGMTMEITLDKWGEAVDIQQPPADKIKKKGSSSSSSGITL